MIFLNLINLTLLSTSLVLIGSASASSSDTLKPVSKKKVLVRTTKLDASPLAATPSDNPQGNKSGRCEMLGTVFAEGSAMASSHECSFCYCIRGERQCVTPRCKLPLRGCKPRYRSASCCPTFYDCHDSTSTTSSTTTTTATTTTASTTASSTKQSDIPTSRIGCFIESQRYFEGQFMPDVGGRCNACYCLKGRPQCTEMRCRPPVKGCTPVMQKQKCCPVRYDCETKENVVSRANGKLPRSDLLPEFGFKFDFDYDDASDLDAGVMENHVRIERQSEPDQIADESEVVHTTQQPLAVDDETTLDTVTVEEDIPLPVDDSIVESEYDTKAPEGAPGKAAAKEDDKLPTSDNAVEAELPETQPSEEPTPNDNIQIEYNIENIIHEEPPPEAISSNSSDIVTEHPDIDYYYDYEVVKDTTKVPTLSITEILSKLRTQNEGSVGTFADFLPDPITGTRVDEENTPKKSLPKEPEKKEHTKTDFVSYDIDVGTSLIAGEDDIVGVGHVIPIDLHAEDDIPPPRLSPLPPFISTTISTTTADTSTTTTTVTTNTSPVTSTDIPTTKSIIKKYTTTEKTKPQSSFLDTFLNLFRAGSSKPGDKTDKPSSTQLSPPPFKEQPPPPFLNPISREENLNADIFEAPPGPSSFFRPPPMGDIVPSSEDIFEDEFVSDTKNELDAELDLDAKPTIENEIRARPKPPNGSVTRNELPIRRRPAPAGTKPFYTGLFASRPNVPSLSNLPNDGELDGALVEHSLPTDPLVEGGFAAIRPTSIIEETQEEEIGLENEEPTLPPSLPNLKIIPFVAADALVNQGSPPEDGITGFTPRPFGSASSLPGLDCREGGKVWSNGEAVAKGDNNPCVLCRCISGKIICQLLECPKVPDLCTAEEKPKEGDCCPLITCDDTANVSIVDTLPRFHPLKDETEDAPSSPIRPSPFSHQNRRPPFAPASRRPSPPKPLSTLRKPIMPPRLRPAKKPTTEEEPTKIEEEEESSKSDPVRPIRPFSRPPALKPLRNSVPQLTGSRPRPFSYLNRTGTRPPFVPPRRTNAPPILATTVPSDSVPLIDASEIPDVVVQISSTDRPALIDSRIPIKEPASIPEEEEEEEPIKPREEDPNDFENIFAELLPKDEDSLPQPIHSIHGDNIDSRFDSDRPFIIPSEILIPKPLPPKNNIGLDGEITNFVKQDKFRFTESSAAPEVVKFGPPIIRIQKPTKRLPEIPEIVKAQLPLGNDPILVSGLFELGGCNVYGRMFEIGEEIQEISGQCKACQCTKVGVQCLPIC